LKNSKQAVKERKHMRIIENKMAWSIKLFLVVSTLLTTFYDCDCRLLQIWNAYSIGIPESSSVRDGASLEDSFGKKVRIVSFGKSRESDDYGPTQEFYLRVNGSNGSVSVSGSANLNNPAGMDDIATHFILEKKDTSFAIKSVYNGKYLQVKPIDNGGDFTINALGNSPDSNAQFYAWPTFSDSVKPLLSLKDRQNSTSKSRFKARLSSGTPVYSLQAHGDSGFLNWCSNENLRTHGKKTIAGDYFPSNATEKDSSYQFYLELVDTNFTPLWLIQNGHAYVRSGMTETTPQGKSWIQATEEPYNFKQISVGPGGHVLGVTTDNKVYYRDGITAGSPEETDSTGRVTQKAIIENLIGNRWVYLTDGITHISVGLNGRTFGIAQDTGSVLLSPAGKAPDQLAGVNWEPLPNSGPGHLQIATGRSGEALLLTRGGDLYVRRNTSMDTIAGEFWGPKIASVTAPSADTKEKIALGMSRAYLSQGSRILKTTPGSLANMTGNWPQFDGPGGNIARITTNAQDIMLCELVDDGTLWFSNLSTGWKKVDAPVEQFIPKSGANFDDCINNSIIAIKNIASGRYLNVDSNGTINLDGESNAAQSSQFKVIRSGNTIKLQSLLNQKYVQARDKGDWTVDTAHLDSITGPQFSVEKDSNKTYLMYHIKSENTGGCLNWLGKNYLRTHNPAGSAPAPQADNTKFIIEIVGQRMATIPENGQKVAIRNVGSGKYLQVGGNRDEPKNTDWIYLLGASNTDKAAQFTVIKEPNITAANQNVIGLKSLANGNNVQAVPPGFESSFIVRAYNTSFGAWETFTIEQNEKDESNTTFRIKSGATYLNWRGGPHLRTHGDDSKPATAENTIPDNILFTFELLP
jgi:hypothetical protein